MGCVYGENGYEEGKEEGAIVVVAVHGATR